MLTKLGRKLHEHIGDFNNEIKNIRKYQMEVPELKNIITELKKKKNTLEEFDNRLDETEGGTSDLKDRAVE